MPPKPTPNPKHNPLTTTGRIAKAVLKRDREMAESALPSPPSPKKKPRKTPVMPPPCEIEAEATLREEAKKAKKNKSKKPLTTKDKIAAANAAKGRKEQAEQDAVSGGKGTKGKVKGERPRNLMDIMRELGQMGSKSRIPAIYKATGEIQAVAPKDRSDGRKAQAMAREKLSVLPRPKVETKRMADRPEHQMQDKADDDPKSASVKVEEVEERAHGQTHTSSRLMDLLPELRQRIWHFAVLETQLFVFPATDHKQPALAMTSQQVRSEVLPIYYGKNTFAIEVSPFTVPAQGDTMDYRLTAPLKLLQKWATTLATAGHVQRIRKWALLWKPLHGSYETSTGKIITLKDQEAIISIRYPRSKTADLHDDARPEVEIHRQACCLLKFHDLFAPCIRQCYPEWLDDVIDTASQQEGNRGKQMILVANGVRVRAGHLADIRCREEGRHP